MEQFDWLPATFKPQRTDDLSAQAAEWIGWEGLWEAAFLIEEGPHEGQFACTVHRKHRERNSGPPAEAFAWVPQCDLEPVNLPPEALREIEERAGQILEERGFRRRDA